MNREITSTELDATVSAICQLAAKHDGEHPGDDRDYRRALMRVGAEHDLARQRSGEAPSPTDVNACDALITTLLARSEQAQRTHGMPLAFAARSVASEHLQAMGAPLPAASTEPQPS